MATRTIPKRTKNLNLTSEQTEIFYNLMEVGCHMAKSLTSLDQMFNLSKVVTDYEEIWSDLLVRFAFLRVDGGCES